MSNTIFTFTRMKAAGKSGILKPDASGYYDVVLGAFNTHNASGAYYPFNDVKKLFTQSSDLMERVTNGQLYGEWGHPKPDPGMSDREYLIKLLTMHEEHISHHIRRIELDESFKDVDGKTCIGVMGSVKPFGPKGEYVREGLETPDINFAFSLRSISHDRRAPDGTLIKVPVKIQTYDGVLEQGIHVADKVNNPAVESKHIFTVADIEGALELACRRGSGLESKAQDLERILAVARRDANKFITHEVTRDLLGMKTKTKSKLLTW